MAGQVVARPAGSGRYDKQRVTTDPPARGGPADPVAIAMLGTGAQLPTVAFMGWFGPHRRPLLRDSTTLMITYLVIGGVGIVRYAYRDLLARYMIPIYGYTVMGAGGDGLQASASLWPPGRWPSHCA